MTEAEKKALSGYKTPELIATYEDLYRVPEQERVTYYYGDYGGHFFKYGMAEESICAAYEKALAAIRMSSEEFQASKNFVYRGGIIARMMDCTVKESSRLRDALNLRAGSSDLFVVHETEDARGIPAEDISKLTSAGREDFATLLDAKVEAVRLADYGIEIVISGVEPQELERFRDTCDAHEQAERAMGPVMG